MPRFDGTGPMGLGPKSGRGKGECGVFGTLCDTSKPLGRVFLSLTATVIVVVAKDAMNPDGISRRVFRSLGNLIAASLSEPKSDANRTIRTVVTEALPKTREAK